MIALAILAVLPVATIAATSEYIWTVGTETNGSPIQQVEWLFKDDGLTVTNCPILAGTPLTLLKEKPDRIEVMCDKEAVPKSDKWAHAILKGNIVVGWLPRSALVKVSIADWKKKQGSAQPYTEGDIHPLATSKYFSYPAGITKRCHLKIEGDNVTVVVLDDRTAVTYPCRHEQDKIIVLGQKEPMILAAQSMQLIDQDNRVFPMVTSESRIKELEDVIRGSPNKPSEATP